MAPPGHRADVARRYVGQDWDHFHRFVRVRARANATPVGCAHIQLADRYADANADSHANPDGDSETNITTTAITHADANP